MSGIYIHIPFCKRTCHYCNFYHTNTFKHQNGLITSLLRELGLQRSFFDTTKVATIYFGGGSPSILPTDAINNILERANECFDISDTSEVTLEANPEDLTHAKLRELKGIGINRLSIGVQSFNDKDLLFLGRKHSVEQSIEAITMAQDCGFNNISIDLIYGLESQKMVDWENNLTKVLEYAIPHLSAYCLTVEPNTGLSHLIEKGKLPDIKEEHAAMQFELLIDFMQSNKYHHYEISNFCKEGMQSIHNSNYWLGAQYLGVGPSAHSYNGKIRQWNISDIDQYIESIHKNAVPFEKEELTPSQKYNEYIMTSLRTYWGCKMDKIHSDFGEKYYQELKGTSQKYIDQSLINDEQQKLVLTDKGKLFADKIIGDLFIDEDTSR